MHPSAPAAVLLQLAGPDGSTLPAASVQSYGPNGGSVIVLLSSEASAVLSSGTGFGVAAHLLARVSNDTFPFSVACAAAGTSSAATSLRVAPGAPNCGVSVAANRGPAGWNVTLINNHGVTKDPGTPVVVDPSAAVDVVLSLRSGYGSISAAWQTTDWLVKPVKVDGNSLSVHLDPGDVQVFGIESWGG
jgi:hypothetical protein